MKPPRSAPSLAKVIGEILATDPHSAMIVTQTDVGRPKRRPATSGRYYRAEVWLDESQMIELNNLIAASWNRTPFIWNDPADGVDKLVYFAEAPSVVTHPASPNSNIKTRVRFHLSFQDDDGTTAGLFKEKA